jgi:amidase
VAGKAVIRNSGIKKGLSAKVRLREAPIWQWSALETAAAIRSGAISTVKVVEAHVEHMRAVNPKLNAVVVDLSEEALRARQTIAESGLA